MLGRRPQFITLLERLVEGSGNKEYPNPTSEGVSAVLVSRKCVWKELFLSEGLGKLHWKTGVRINWSGDRKGGSLSWSLCLV